MNTETLTETVQWLYLSVQMRNVSEAPVSADFDQATYSFEYEIDGTTSGSGSRRGWQGSRRSSSKG